VRGLQFCNSWIVSTLASCGRLPAIIPDLANRTRSLIHEVQLRYILQGGLDDFQKCFIDSTAVEANTERPTDSTILVRLIARVRTTGATCTGWVFQT
jgi:hypothetical protein